jgi:L-ascorbate metabolism protein UlaG (beta-lactamase superfamily)
LRLREDVSIQVLWSDRTPCGGPIGGRLDDRLRTVTAEATAALTAGAPLADVHAALHDAVDSAGFATLVERTAGGWRVRPDVLAPDPRQTTPVGLAIGGADGPTAEVALPPGHWAAAHALLAALAGDGAPRSERTRPADMQALLDGLAGGGLVVPCDGCTPVADTGALAGSGATFVGHSTVLVASDRTRVVVDPFLLPYQAGHRDGYRPFDVAQLGRLDAVLITHAHPDHCDWGTLLRLPPEVPVIVPAVDRETALAPDLALRLRQLGRDDVRPRAPGALERIGDLEIHVLPFHGEQPSDGPRLHEDVRNAGNLYVIRTPNATVACVADAGRDAAGDVRGTAASWRRDHDPVDVLFSGYRGWFTYPAQVLLSSVARYFLFVDPSAWPTRLQLMNDAADAVDTAERFGASVLVPYSAGGAPWYWERGLGPRADTGLERPGFDPLPERVREAAATRTVAVTGGAVPSPVDVRILRPGDAIDRTGHLRRTPGHAWPYDEAVAS